ncbi:vacuolar membrane protein-domain-containing protein [Kickxella alabastrina]|uniref:vacuolar membrane protein-domain-containing protein n=1 Tax=Kickxella alabastrina TaxID=61397 RepID=UPI002220A54F|nr:vacuolar membrane protein-domain-containing protein [Kickxella alabastrina]KAI7829205.1 vacuolar membrane protein-domain-containing protein [Kickxella alabastrina]
MNTTSLIDTLAATASTAVSALISSSTMAETLLQPTPSTAIGAVSALLPSTDEVFKCRLVGPFSLVVQTIVGTLGFSTLVIKRHFEKPRRPWLVWSFDVSKQVIGGSMMHMSNLLVAALSGRGPEGENMTNPCSWYVLNLTLDCTLGVLIVAGFLTLYGNIAQRLQITGLESGHYGDPPNWRRWIKQASIFCASMISMKLTVILLITLMPFLVAIGDGILKPVQMLHSPHFEIIFVMAIWPLTLNIFESWVLDQFIKRKLNHRDAASVHVHGAMVAGDEDSLYDAAARFSTSFEMSSSSVGSRNVHRSSALHAPRQVSMDMSEFEIGIISDGEDEAIGSMNAHGGKRDSRLHPSYMVGIGAEAAVGGTYKQKNSLDLDASSDEDLDSKLLAKQSKLHNS